MDRGCHTPIVGARRPTNERARPELTRPLVISGRPGHAAASRSHAHSPTPPRFFAGASGRGNPSRKWPCPGALSPATRQPRVDRRKALGREPAHDVGILQ